MLRVRSLTSPAAPTAAAAFVVMIGLCAGAGAPRASSASVAVGRVLYLAVRPNASGNVGQIETLDPGTGLRHEVTKRRSDAIEGWSPDGRHILFVRFTPRYKNGRRFLPDLSRLYVVNADGSGLRRLTKAADASDACWSSDGRRIAFTRANEASASLSDSGLYVVNLDGSHLRRLVSAFRLSGCAWTPDGRRIVYEYEEPDIYNQLRVVSTGGGKSMRLAGGLGDNVDVPAISPDGKTVAFVRFLETRTGIFSRLYLIGIDGSNERSLTGDTSSTFHEQGEAWSPDGKRIAFVHDKGPSSEVDVINADGSGQRTLVLKALGGFGWTPAWSPDGARIVYCGIGEGNVELYLVNADGSDQQRLTRTSKIDEIDPSWEPPQALARS